MKKALPELVGLKSRKDYPMTKTPEHTDKLGKLISVKDCVAFPDHNTLCIGLVTKLNPKTIRIKKFGKLSSRYNPEVIKYPRDTIIVNSPDLTMHLIKQTS